LWNVQKRVLIVGYGYLGMALGFELVRRGHEVFGIRRTVTEEVREGFAGVHFLFADITQPETLISLPRNYDWVVNCTSTGGGTPEEYHELYVNGNANLIEWLRDSPPTKFVYTSSTSVYGQNDGSRVTESDMVAPEAGTANELVQAEEVLLSAFGKSKFPAVILRLSGIYGPGRGYWLKQFLQDEARLDGDGSRYLNMIHLQDAVGAIIAALENAAPGSVINASDDEPVRQEDLFLWLSTKLKKPMPPARPEAATRRRAVTNKRISNERLRMQLGYQLKYPSFREGFAVELARIRS
jgi:nucleoside-diphosphate-sugar epimerase